MGLFTKECTCKHDILKQQFDDYTNGIKDNYRKDISQIRKNLDTTIESIKQNIIAELQPRLEEELIRRFSDLEERLKGKTNGKKVA
jgi:DNA anti-recombination protein RmuC